MDGRDSVAWLVRSDLWRYTGNSSIRTFAWAYARIPGFRYTVWYRIARRLGELPWGRFGPRQCASWKLRRLGTRFGIELPPEVTIGPGFYIGHVGGIVVHPSVSLGRDCNMSHDVTIGMSSRGPRAGCPTLGDRIYIGPGAKIFGSIHVGDDVAIGANSVVNSDVPNGSVIVGVPGRIASQEGSKGYICNVDY